MKWRYRIPLWALALVVVLVVVRLSLPYVVRHYLNGRLAHMGDYSGHVADVDLHFWRGAYSLDDLRVTKVSGKVPVPLLNTPRMDIAVSWRALRHGHVRASVDFRRPVLNFVDGSGKADSQAGTGVDWRAQLQKLIPVRLDEVNVHDGTVTFRNFVSSPRVDLKATDVQGSVVNLTNANRARGRRVATLHATANILGQAPLETSARFDPLEKHGDFSFELRVLRIQLTRLNDLARAYANLDFSSGHGDFVMELDARDGQLTGYAKPLFKDMQIFSWKQDVEQEHKNPFRIAWEALAQGVTWIFSNHAQDQFATRIPISGRVDDKKLGFFRAVLNVLHNAFVKAYTPQLEHLRPAPKGK
ncbi:MAG TPA: DUF748 domain-containing protein [Rhodanobacteraceae bacterium]|jgi:hypothetical protein|nr:DUF748 domain-containing protein [Rhodanobacteraceae bacterium]